MNPKKHKKNISTISKFFLFLSISLLSLNPLSCAFGDEDALEALYSSGDSLYVAAGNTNSINYSDDGKQWYTTTVPTAANFSSVAVGEGVIVITGQGGNSVFHSNDGVNWNQYNLTAAIVSCAAYGNGLFIAGDNTGVAYYSTNLTKWEIATNSPGGSTLESAAYGNGKYAMVESAAINYSTDAKNWKSNNLADGFSYLGITYAKNKFVAIGNNGANSIIRYSSDGVNWSGNVCPVSAPRMYDVAYGGKRFVAVGNAKTYYISDDAVTWSGPFQVPGAGVPNLYGVTYGNRLFVAVGETGIIHYSEDGTEWSDNVGPGGNNLQDVGYLP